MQVVDIRQLTGTDVLAGAKAGTTHLAKLVAATRSAKAEAVVLDFSGVELATVSWLRDAVVGFRKHCVCASARIFPVAVGMSTGVTEEFSITLEACRETHLVGRIRNGLLVDVGVVGELDHALADTLDVAVGLGTFEAADIQKHREGLSLSALGNRLTSLEEKGLLVSERQGRSRRYRTILEGMQSWAQK